MHVARRPSIHPSVSCPSLTRKWTSSPAVAERPRDASCLSVASIVQYVERKFCFRVTAGIEINSYLLFCSLWSSMLQAVINLDSMMRRRLCAVCDKLHGGLSHLLLARQQSSIDSHSSTITILPTPPAFDAPVRGGGLASEYYHDV